MRLSKIKLAGFKSFVDPTTIAFPSNLLGIVGPNGCGKSNIIDAVRWVMGEISAKHLRGDSMADVIFNGSSARKPVGTASVELVFDNSDGSAGGQYANYAEISIKRVVSRDGTSSYFLNGARCRRRDITDIFLGTGLGPRSYAIIEQGMISRLIEAKPEELRMFLEEAAGISKYKERRKETESRIRNTKENLDRLNDLRSEIEKQLQHLQRQARAAERYKELKTEERRTRAELIALRWRELDAEVSSKDRIIGEKETELEAAIAEQRALENRIEKTRERQTEASDRFNEVQARYYAIGAEIARHEQAIQHARELRARQENELRQTEHAWRELQGHIARDHEQLADIERGLAELEPALERARAAESTSAAALAAVEADLQQWQAEWDTFNRDSSSAAQAAQVGRTQVEHLERQMQQLLARAAKLKDELGTLSDVALRGELETLESERAKTVQHREALQRELEEVLSAITAKRESERQLGVELHEVRTALEDARGRLASLEALQQAALGKSDETVNEWLARHGLGNLPRLAERLHVEAGWERAVETVLGFYLEAVCVEQIDSIAEAVTAFDGGAVTLIDGRAHLAVQSEPAGTLLAKIRTELPVAGLLNGVFIASDLKEALVVRARLMPGQSVITPDGVWLGANWVRVNREQHERSGVLARENEIRTLKETRAALDEKVMSVTARQETERQALRELEERREELQAEVNRAHRRYADLGAQCDARRLRLEQIEQRAARINSELHEIEQQLEQIAAELRAARGNVETSLANLEDFSARQAELEARREALRTRLEDTRKAAASDREAAHALALKIEARRSTRDSLRQNLQRMQGQLEQLTARRAEIEEYLKTAEDPVQSHRDALNGLLTRHREVEAELAQARQLLETLDDEVRTLERERAAKEKFVQEIRSALEAFRLASQEARVRRQTLQEQLAESHFELETLFGEMPAEATIPAWEERLMAVEQRLQRLGNVNLMAIEEYAEQSQRKEYLDRQHADLTEALTTLENAIRKIDRETRTRFKETFDKVNAGLQASFPRLFGGGHAYLEMTGEDLLDAGVAVMARPPGKRNSTIHLLSGGEKALTAVALVFAIFELNPAPFCMLDEVDAPLDDANVGRFCDLVREMSERVQFVFITHNKTTMEMAHQLVGVTMNEPGVSRLVAVDVDEAVRMAAM